MGHPSLTYHIIYYQVTKHTVKSCKSPILLLLPGLQQRPSRECMIHIHSHTIFPNSIAMSVLWSLPNYLSNNQCPPFLLLKSTFCHTFQGLTISSLQFKSMDKFCFRRRSLHYISPANNGYYTVSFFEQDSIYRLLTHLYD